MNKNKLQQVGAFLSIPFALAVPPIIGWLIGKWLDKLLHTSPYFMYILLFLGVAAGALECYRIIKEYGNHDE